ncbi:hypothetical protein BG004_004817 [Podila humilis]|nr:hypothetical protein BG004_004817 [Podila humilis]
MEQYQRDVEAGLVPGSASHPPKLTGKPSSTVSTSPPSSFTQPPTPPAPSAAAPPSAADLKTETTQDSTELEQAATLPAKPVPEPVDETIGQPGQWQAVEVPASRLGSGKLNENKGGGVNNKNSNSSSSPSHHVAGADDDEDEEHDPEDLRGFKVVEKTYPTDNQSDQEGDSKNKDGENGAPMFKKRKAGATKTRNIRRKV